MKKYLRNRLCIPIEGYNRAIIYDLLRMDYFFIPIELYRIISSQKVFEINEEMKEWENFFLKEEIIFEVENDQESQMFPNISKEYLSPVLLTNVIIHENLNLNVVSYFDNLYLLNLTIIVEKFDQKKIYDIIQKFTIYEINSVSLFIKDETKNFIKNDFESFITGNQVLNIFTFKSKKNEKKEITRKFAHANWIKLTCSFVEYTTKMVSSKLQVNHSFFLEAYNHHNYFNQKLYIDSYGFIKNGLNNYQNFGNINSVSRKEFLKTIRSNKFQYLWDIKKEDTLICKDCEFKYMCVDSRAPEQNKDKYWYHEQECNYNPYISKWVNEKGYRNLKESGIDISKEGTVSINKKILKETFEVAWN